MKELLNRLVCRLICFSVEENLYRTRLGEVRPELSGIPEDRQAVNRKSIVRWVSPVVTASEDWNIRVEIAMSQEGCPEGPQRSPVQSRNGER